jgi:hypothetical protein
VDEYDRARIGISEEVHAVARRECTDLPRRCAPSVLGYARLCHEFLDACMVADGVNVGNLPRLLEGA